MEDESPLYQGPISQNVVKFSPKSRMYSLSPNDYKSFSENYTHLTVINRGNQVRMYSTTEKKNRFKRRIVFGHEIDNVGDKTNAGQFVNRLCELSRNDAIPATLVRYEQYYLKEETVTRTFYMICTDERLCAVQQIRTMEDVMKDHMLSNKFLPINQIISWSEQLLSALDWFHSTIREPHRNVVPSSIFVDGETIILGSYGIGFENLTIDQLTDCEEYLAPEVKEDMNFSFKSDIFSLSVILLRLLTLEVCYC